MASKKDNRLAWGVTLLVFGILFLVRQLHILPPDISTFAFNIKNYPFIIGIIFIIFHANREIGIVLLVLGLIYRLSDIIRWTQNISDYIWPAVLIIAGILLIYGLKKGK